MLKSLAAPWVWLPGGYWRIHTLVWQQFRSMPDAGRGSNPATTQPFEVATPSGAESRRYALARPCFCVMSRLEISRDVGLAKSVFRPTGHSSGTPNAKPLDKPLLYIPVLAPSEPALEVLAQVTPVVPR